MEEMSSAYFDCMDALSFLKSVCEDASLTQVADVSQQDREHFIEQCQNYESELRNSRHIESDFRKRVIKLMIRGKRMLDLHDFDCFTKPSERQISPALHLDSPTVFRLPRGAGGWDVPPLDTFKVRSGSYLKDKVKLETDPPLFHFRGVQMFRTEEVMTHVAEREWSAYPKHPQENEWLILNYMVSEGPE
jgi:hypothetical protein